MIFRGTDHFVYLQINNKQKLAKIYVQNSFGAIFPSVSMLRTGMNDGGSFSEMRRTK